MKETFVDASFLVALAFATDTVHERALAWNKALSGPFVVTKCVLLEIADGACVAGLRKTAHALIHYVRAEKSMTVVPLDTLWLDRGYQRFCRYKDKDWSLTDCISFAVMHDRGITDALAHDHHFEQTGFRALLRHDPPSN